MPEGQIGTILHLFLFHPLLKTTHRKRPANPLKLCLKAGSFPDAPLPGLDFHSIEDLLIRSRRP